MLKCRENTLVDKQEGKWLKHIIPSQLIIPARVQVLEALVAAAALAAEAAALAAEAAALAAAVEEVEALAAEEVEAVEDLVFMEERNSLVKLGKVEVKVDAATVVATGR